MTPRRLYETDVEALSDPSPPRINAMICTKTNKLILIDDNNNKIKMVDMSQLRPSLSSSIQLEREPFAAAEMPDGQVAVTTVSKVIYFVKITKRDLDIRVFLAEYSPAVGQFQIKHDQGVPRFGSFH